MDERNWIVLGTVIGLLFALSLPFVIEWWRKRRNKRIGVRFSLDDKMSKPLNELHHSLEDIKVEARFTAPDKLHVRIGIPPGPLADELRQRGDPKRIRNWPPPPPPRESKATKPQQPSDPWDIDEPTTFYVGPDLIPGEPTRPYGSPEPAPAPSHHAHVEGHGGHSGGAGATGGWDAPVSTPEHSHHAADSHHHSAPDTSSYSSPDPSPSYDSGSSSSFDTGGSSDSGSSDGGGGFDP